MACLGKGYNENMGTCEPLRGKVLDFKHDAGLWSHSVAKRCRLASGGPKRANRRRGVGWGWQ